MPRWNLINANVIIRITSTIINTFWLNVFIGVFECEFLLDRIRVIQKTFLCFNGFQ